MQRAALCLLVAGAALLTACGSKPAAANGGTMPPPEVEVTAASQENVDVFSEWVATIDGSVNAQIQPQVTGYLIRQTYTEGSPVQKGQVLFEIDPRPFQAVLDQMKGQLAQAQGQVIEAESQVRHAESQEAQALAQLGKAELDVKRDEPLAKAHAIAQSQLDTEMQALAAARATVKAAQASIATSQAAVKSAGAAVVAAKANVAQAELNLEFTKVRSLVDGVAGIAQTQIGNLVKTDTVLTTVSQVNPIRVYFPISEREYLGWSLEKGARRGVLDSQSVPLDLVLTGGSVYPHKGRVIFVNREVDAATGTIRVAAAFPNPGNILRPGQFGRVRAMTSKNATAILIPQRAVTELQGKFQVAVIGSDNKVKIRQVTLGSVLGSRYIVESGLTAGERVVVEGLARAMDGATVSPKQTASQAPASRESSGQ